MLVPQRGNASMVVLPNNGVKLSGMIFDAGPVNSPVLLSVGTPGFARRATAPADPDLIQDIFFRIGGAETTPVSATVSLLDNADNSIIDDIWAWRADHGANTSVTGPQGQDGAGWTYNQGDTGLAVTGDNVTAYGLAVEHYQKNEVIWSGNKRHGDLLPERVALRPAQPDGVGSVPDPARLSLLPGGQQRPNLPRVRHG